MPASNPVSQAPCSCLHVAQQMKKTKLWFSTGAHFSPPFPQGHLLMSADSFVWHNWAGVSRVEANDAARHPTVHKTAPHSRELPSPRHQQRPGWKALPRLYIGGTNNRTQWPVCPFLPPWLSSWAHLLTPKKLHRCLQRMLRDAEESERLVNVELLRCVKLLVKVIFISLFKLVWELELFFT